MEDDFKDLQALLRLKKHEAPPTEYFEDFLHEFHRCQRAELLRRPLWRLALDRLEGALPTFSPARYAYTGSCALAVTAAAVASGHILLSHPREVRAGQAIAFAGATPVKTAQQGKSVFPRLTLHGNGASRLGDLNFDGPGGYTDATKSTRPRYVLDTQPVSYEQPSSF